MRRVGRGCAAGASTSILSLSRTSKPASDQARCDEVEEGNSLARGGAGLAKIEEKREGLRESALQLITV